MAFKESPGGLYRLLESPTSPVSVKMRAIGQRIERRAKVLCPVDTGDLRASIKLQQETTSEGIAYRIGSNLRYAAYVELGTGWTRAQPYLRPAMEQVIREL